jgi:hypothetical protein
MSRGAPRAPGIIDPSYLLVSDAAAVETGMNGPYFPLD